MGGRVAVRRTRAGLELRVRGTLASLARSDGSVTGPVWWGLAAPLLLVSRRRRRVLLLGLAAGSVARAVRALDPEAAIVGVERDSAVLQAARRHFGLDRLGIEIVEDDAFRYLERERRRFDLVVEDLFVGTSRSVRKPEGLIAAGYRRMRGRLRPGGLITCNTIHETPAVRRALAALGGRVLTLHVRGHWNRLLVWGEGLPPARALRRRLAAEPRLSALLRAIAVRSEPAAERVSPRAARERRRRRGRAARRGSTPTARPGRR